MPRRRRTEMPRRGKKPKLVKTTGDSIPRQIAGGTGGHSEAPSVYLVVGHQFVGPAYSVFEVKPFWPPPPVAPPPTLLARLNANPCMSFLPVRSRHGDWILGVGGESAEDHGPETLVFDIKTRAVIPGPKLSSAKVYPILLPVGDRIYALAFYPAVKGDINFLPWFEVLDLSRAQVVDGRLVSEWKPLPRPPFFPWELTPIEYTRPPEISVKSHVAVGSYILVSVTGQPGTHMFDTGTEQWAKLDDKDLPFIRGAVPHGPLFLGFSSARKRITGYKIMDSPSITASCPSLTIVEFPMVTDMDDEEEDVVGRRVRFVTLSNPDSPGFCTFNCRNGDPSFGYEHTLEFVTARAYRTEDPLSEDRLESVHCISISMQWKQMYRIRDLRRGLSWPCLEAAVSF